MGIKERHDIVRLCRTSGSDDGVLFSLLPSTGLSGLEGDRLLVMGDGSVAGAIAGGVFDADLLRRSKEAVPSGAVLERFGTESDAFSSGNEANFLVESQTTPEAQAVLDAMEAASHGMARIVATVLPDRNPILRIVLDPATDVLFASEALSTPEIVDVRSAALRAAHASIVEQAGGRIFVERLDSARDLVYAGDESGALAAATVLASGRALQENAGEQAKARRIGAAEEHLLAQGPDGFAKRDTCKTFEVDAAMAAEAAQKATVTL
jgi:xanthine/CO dehydrogenase XdhC/CoxF family maturation factor